MSDENCSKCGARKHPYELDTKWYGYEKGICRSCAYERHEIDEARKTLLRYGIDDKLVGIEQGKRELVEKFLLKLEESTNFYSMIEPTYRSELDANKIKNWLKSQLKTEAKI